MTHYQVALFVHILAVIGLFIAMSLEFASMIGMRRAHTVAQVREWISLEAVLGRLFPITAVLILVSGLYLIHEQWGSGTPWSTVSLLLLIALSVSGAVVNGSRLRTIHTTVHAAKEEAISPALAGQIHDPILWTSVQVGAAIAVGIVYLMTLKPDLLGSLVTIAIVIVLGLVSALPTWRGTHAEVLQG